MDLDRMKNAPRALAVYCALGAIVVSAPAIADDTAQARIHLNPVHRQGIVLPTSGPEHVLFGQIKAVRMPYFTMLLRTGRIINVNAKPAVDSGRFSAPLFAGKFVVITGRTDSSGLLQADTVTRQTHIDSRTSFDR